MLPKKSVANIMLIALSAKLSPVKITVLLTVDYKIKFARVIGIKTCSLDAQKKKLIIFSQTEDSTLHMIACAELAVVLFI